MATLTLTKDNFTQSVNESDILFVDFWAEWCGPCKRFGPIFEAAADQHTDVTFGKLDTESEQELAAAAGISSIPTLMAFREGILVFSQPGALPAPALEQIISAVKDLDMTEVRKALEEEASATGK